MKLTKKQKVAILVVATVVAVSFVFRDKLKALMPGRSFGNSGDATQPPTTGGDTPVPADNGGSGGNQGNTSPQVGCSSNCCGNVCDEISENNPAMNYGCCGIAVKNWQNYLNTVVPQNVYPLISEDGAYGSQTQAKHQAYLTMMPTTGEDIVAPVYESGSGGSVGSGYTDNFYGPTL